MKHFFRALKFLTILPVSPKNKDEAPLPLAETAAFFPLVGIVIGILCYALFWCVSFWLPWRLSVLVLLSGPVILTGGLHVDGLSDFCDGFFSARASREEILRIMRDSRIGVMGALGLVLTLLAKYELLVMLGAKPLIFFFMLAASRTVQVVLAYFLPYARSESGMAQGFAGHISRNGLASAVGLTLLLGLVTGTRFVFWETVFLAAFAFLFCVMAKKRLGGVTGDLLGAASEFAELLVLFVAVGIGL